MSLISVVRWTVRLSSSAFFHFCPRCDARQEHRFSGRARVNAHHKVLDAWLLYDCVHCERTAKVPVFERRLVGSIDPVLLDGLHRNDPAVLEPMAARLVGGSTFEVDGASVQAGWIVLQVDPGVRIRLDRVLARGLGMSRSEVARRCPSAPLRKPARSGLRVEVVPAVQQLEAPVDPLQRGTGSSGGTG